MVRFCAQCKQSSYATSGPHPPTTVPAIAGSHHNKPMPKLIIRQTRLEDIDALVRLQREVYPHIAAWHRDRVVQQIEMFPQGQLVAYYDNRLSAVPVHWSSAGMSGPTSTPGTRSRQRAPSTPTTRPASRSMAQRCSSRPSCAASGWAIENQVYVAVTGTVGNLPVEGLGLHYGQAAIITPSDFPFARDGIAAEGVGPTRSRS